MSDCMSPSGPLAAHPLVAVGRGRSADLRRVALLHQTLLIVRLAQDHVVLQEELVSDAEPLVTQLAGKAVQVINVLLGSHDHLECWDEFTARCTVPRHTKQP